VNVDNYRAACNQLIRNPDDPAALVSQYANVAQKIEYGKHYVPLAKRAYEIAPEQTTALFNYASALHRTGHFEQALKLYLKGLPLVDDDWRGRFLHHVGIAYRALNENKKACEYYLKAYEAVGDPEILKDRAISTLASGDLQEGFRQFEIRKECAAKRLEKNAGKLVAQQKLPADVVYWKGQDLNGKTVVVYHEEGQGDFIQFCRYIPKLRELGAAKVFLCGPADGLLDLAADNVAVDGIVPLSGPFECDYVIGSMSVPWRVGIDYASVSGKQYFNAEPANIPQRGALNVGLVWRGNSEYGMDAHRSIAFSEFCPLFDIPNVAFYSLQKGPAAIEVTTLGYDGFVANLEPLATTWRNTARLIQALDVIVTVDTAVAHLAGALGKPVYILCTNASDWRWNRNSEKTAWYDSARVIRQKKQDDWAPCIANVRDKLKGMMSERRRQAA
jgi:tetratricopeptide (TPR) repeat protein